MVFEVFQIKENSYIPFLTGHIKMLDFSLKMFE